MIFKKYIFEFDIPFDDLKSILANNTYEYNHELKERITRYKHVIEEKPTLKISKSNTSFSLFFYTFGGSAPKKPELGSRFYGKFMKKEGKTLLVGRFLLVKVLYIIFAIFSGIPLYSRMENTSLSEIVFYILFPIFFHIVGLLISSIRNIEIITLLTELEVLCKMPKANN